MTLGNPDAKWSKWDVLIAEAYEIVQREKCPQCNMPKWLCHNDDNDIGFVTVEDHCSAKQEDARAEKQRKDKAVRPGTMFYQEPRLTDPKRDFTEYRVPFYKTQAAMNATESG